jgi:hypothetical protein
LITVHGHLCNAATQDVPGTASSFFSSALALSSLASSTLGQRMKSLEAIKNKFKDNQPSTVKQSYTIFHLTHCSLRIQLFLTGSQRGTAIVLKETEILKGSEAFSHIKKNFFMDVFKISISSFERKFFILKDLTADPFLPMI